MAVVSGGESMSRRERWRSDEHYLTSGVPGQPEMRLFDPGECSCVSGCSCWTQETGPTVSVTGGNAAHLLLPADWGPVAAEAAVDAAWDREAAARLTAIATADVRVDTVTTEDRPLLPSEQQMAAQRDSDYGHPGPNWTTTAELWREYLHAKHGVMLPLDTDDVGMLNMLQKIARQARNPKRDNLDDIAGYADATVMAQSDP